MLDKLKLLVGKSLHHPGRDELQEAVTFGLGDAGVNIYNPVKTFVNNKEIPLDQLDGKVLQDMREVEEKEYVFAFDHDYSIIVDLRPEVYTSPEAINFYFPDGTVVIVP